MPQDSRRLQCEGCGKTGSVTSHLVSESLGGGVADGNAVRITTDLTGQLQHMGQRQVANVDVSRPRTNTMERVSFQITQCLPLRPLSPFYT